LTFDAVGKGSGATTGVMTGGGGGGGGGSTIAAGACACADVGAATMARSPKRIAPTVTELRPAPQQSLARENHDEQRINAFPKKTGRQLDKKSKKSPSAAPICPQFSRSVNRS